MLQSNNVSYAPVHSDVRSDEESVSFIPTGIQASSTSSGNHHLTYSIDGSEDTSTTFISNDNYNTSAAAQLQSQNQQGNEVEIVAAVAVPNTIRPPKVRTSTYTHPSVTFAKKLAILLCGLFLAYISSLESLVFFAYKSIVRHELTFFLISAVWAISTMCLVAGSIVGAYKGKWRLLAPGIAAYHTATLISRLVI
eukprot:scaffold1202_cov257-Chaetoceros_neogracile.AAC.1